MQHDNSRLKMINISKSFSGVQVLKDVNLELVPGEVHALVGENGAGKSTLIKILSGAYQRDGGEIFLDGEKVDISNPNQALGQGIMTIYQETNTAQNLSVAENIYMGRLPKSGPLFVNKKKLYQDSDNILAELGLDISSKDSIADLTRGHSQVVEIAKALIMDARVIVMDEPTAALTDREVDVLFKIIRNLKAKNVSIILITHRLAEVFEICDRATVLRDGEWITTQPVSDIDENFLINNMVGRDVDDLYPDLNEIIGEIALDVKNISGKQFNDISFTIRSGEIVGFFGLVGSGRTDIAKALFGVDSIKEGSVILDGEKFAPRSPQDSISSGLSLVPEERKSEGLILDMSVLKNITLPSIHDLSRFGFIQKSREKSLANQYRDALQIRCADIKMDVKHLSGGNQQKVVLAKWLAKDPRIFVMDEPTRGVDVGGKAEVHGLMVDLTKNGVGIMMISSDLPEILGMSDRIYVMYEGSIIAEIPAEGATEELVMYHATGQLDHENNSANQELQSA